MSTGKLTALIDEAIKLEENMAELYTAFHRMFKEGADPGFWWKLALEERSHAALLQTEKQYGLPGGLFPKDVVATTLGELEEANARVRYQLEQNKSAPPTRKEALSFALNTEVSAGEYHFQAALEKKPENRALELFQKLADDDRDHARRLREYMEQQGF